MAKKKEKRLEIKQIGKKFMQTGDKTSWFLQANTQLEFYFYHFCKFYVHQSFLRNSTIRLVQGTQASFKNVQSYFFKHAFDKLAKCCKTLGSDEKYFSLCNCNSFESTSCEWW